MATRHHHWRVRVGAPMHGPPRFISAQYSPVGGCMATPSACCARFVVDASRPRLTARSRPITVIHPTDHTDHTDHTDQSQLNMSTQLCCAVTAKHNTTSTKLNCLCCYIISQSCCCIMCQPGKFLISVLLNSPRTVSVLFIHHERQHTTI